MEAKDYSHVALYDLDQCIEDNTPDVDEDSKEGPIRYVWRPCPDIGLSLSDDALEHYGLRSTSKIDGGCYFEYL